MKPILQLSLLILLSSCSVFRSGDVRRGMKVEKEVLRSPVFSRFFTGFTLLDPATGRVLADVNGDRYFTPASNTKILTLATALTVLGDSLPGMLYLETDHTLIFRGLADPTFLHYKFQDWQQIAERIRTAPQKGLTWYPDPAVEPFGAGWAWDDAPFAYSAERSVLPLFGNVERVYAVAPDSLTVDKPYWHITSKLEPEQRLGNNKVKPQYGEKPVYYNALDTFSSDFETFIPFRNVTLRTLTLFDSALGRKVLYYCGDNLPLQLFRRWYSTPIDTVLRRMMHQSDNFIAEQLLLSSAFEKLSFFEDEAMIKWMLDSVLTTLPQRPKWVDGSGLSRYNLMTPQSIAQVLLRLWKTQPKERLLSLFPAGGVSAGTMQNCFAGKDGKPYIFAKSGSMGGVYCLSGYIVCNSGKTLIFSSMNNNFVGTNQPVKAEIQRILELVQRAY